MSFSATPLCHPLWKETEGNYWVQPVKDCGNSNYQSLVCLCWQEKNPAMIPFGTHTCSLIPCMFIWKYHMIYDFQEWPYSVPVPRTDQIWGYIHIREDMKFPLSEFFTIPAPRLCSRSPLYRNGAQAPHCPWCQTKMHLSVGLTMDFLKRHFNA